MARKSPRPKPPYTIQQLAERKYSDPALARRVVQDAIDHKTHEQIEDGILALPHETDARRHFERVDAEAEDAREEQHDRAAVGGEPVDLTDGPRPE